MTSLENMTGPEDRDALSFPSVKNQEVPVNADFPRLEYNSEISCKDRQGGEHEAERTVFL